VAAPTKPVWPAWVSAHPELKNRLEGIAHDLADAILARERYRDWSAGDFPRETRKALRLSRELLYTVSLIHARSLAEFGETTAKDAADAMLRGRLNLTDDEIARARLGYQPETLRLPLAGLTAHLSAVDALHRKGGRPGKGMERWGLARIVKTVRRRAPDYCTFAEITGAWAAVADAATDALRHMLPAGAPLPELNPPTDREIKSALKR